MLTQNNQVSCEHVNAKDVCGYWSSLDNARSQLSAHLDIGCFNASCLVFHTEIICAGEKTWFSLAESNLRCRSSSSNGLHRDLTHIFDIGSNAMFHPIHAVLANHRFVQQPAGRLDGPQKSAWSGEKPFYVRCGPGCYRSTCQLGLQPNQLPSTFGFCCTALSLCSYAKYEL